MSCQPMNFLASLCVPEIDRFVVIATNNDFSVGRESGAPHGPLTVSKGSDLTASFRVPDADSLVVARGYQQLAVGRERDRINVMTVPFELPHLFSTPHRPNT